MVRNGTVTNWNFSPLFFAHPRFITHWNPRYCHVTSILILIKLLLSPSFSANIKRGKPKLELEIAVLVFFPYLHHWLCLKSLLNFLNNALLTIGMIYEPIELRTTKRNLKIQALPSRLPRDQQPLKWWNIAYDTSKDLINAVSHWTSLIQGSMAMRKCANQTLRILQSGHHCWKC